jgi:hypothetical protein
MEKKNSVDRMKELIKGLESNSEVFKNEDSSEVNENSIKESYAKMNSNAKGTINEFFHDGGRSQFGFGGQVTQNNPLFIDTSEMNSPNVNVGAKNPLPLNSKIEADEAFEIAIKRVLKSGEPINNISFYDEVNRQLVALGFGTKKAIDIKDKLMSMIKKA